MCNYITRRVEIELFSWRCSLDLLLQFVRAYSNTDVDYFDNVWIIAVAHYHTTKIYCCIVLFCCVELLLRSWTKCCKSSPLFLRKTVLLQQ